MNDNQRAQAAEALLDEFSQQVPLRPEHLPTFMEITRYPHYEDVCSNILAFFFNPDNPHGLGTLFLDALAQVGDIEDQAGTLGRNVQVGREDPTDAGRIDILIQSDSHAVLIENKIFWGVDNPLDDYAKHLDSLPQCHKYRFLLTLKPVDESTKREIERYRFQNITHEDLVNEIRGLLGGYVTNADTRYLTFMLDFLNTLDYLQEGMVMNPEFVDFLKARSSEVEDLFKEIKAFKNELRTKVTGLGNLLIDIASYDNVSQWKHREDGLFDTLVHDIDIRFVPDFMVAVDTIVSPEGWKVQIFPRKVRKGNSDKQVELQNLLTNLEIPFEEGERFTVKTYFGYEADLGQIAPVVRDVVNKLAGSDGTS